LFTHKSVPVIFEPPCIFETVEVEAAYCFGTSVIFRHFHDAISENNVQFEDDCGPLFSS